MPSPEYVLARRKRLETLRAQDGVLAANKAGKQRSLVDEALNAAQEEQDEQWAGSRADLLQSMQTHASSLPIGSAQASAATASASQAEAMRQRQSKHAATMRMVKARHRSMVEQIRTSRQQSEATKQEQLQRRRRVFQADRLKAHRITVRAQQQRTAKRQLQQQRRHEQTQHEAQRCLARTVIQPAGAVGESGTTSRTVPVTIKRHHNQGADGRGAAVEELVSCTCRTAAAKKSAAEASAAADRELAHARHRRALSEVRLNAAKPDIEAALDSAQQQHQRQKLQRLAQHQREGVRDSQRQGPEDAFKSCERTFMQQASARSAAGELPRAQQSRRSAYATGGIANVQVRSRAEQQLTDQRVSQWQPVSAVLPRPDKASVAAVRDELGLLETGAAPGAKPAAVVAAARAQRSGNEQDVLPAGFFAETAHDVTEAQSDSASALQGPNCSNTATRRKESSANASCGDNDALQMQARRADLGRVRLDYFEIRPSIYLCILVRRPVLTLGNA